MKKMKKLKKPVRNFLELITAFQGMILISVNDFSMHGLKALVGLVFSFVVCVAILERY